jgi:hypothetical protein
MDGTPVFASTNFAGSTAKGRDRVGQVTPTVTPDLRQLLESIVILCRVRPEKMEREAAEPRITPHLG